MWQRLSTVSARGWIGSRSCCLALRGVDAQDMIAKAGAHLATPAPGAASDKVLVADDMAALFGLDMADEAVLVPAAAALPTRRLSERATRHMLAKAVASKRENTGPGPTEITANVRPGHGKSSASPKPIDGAPAPRLRRRSSRLACSSETAM